MTADDTPARIYLCHNRNGHPRFEEVGPDDIGAEAWVKEGAGVRVDEATFMDAVWNALKANAKAAAQADYEARLLAALDVTP